MKKSDQELLLQVVQGELATRGINSEFENGELSDDFPHCHVGGDVRLKFKSKPGFKVFIYDYGELNLDKRGQVHLIIPKSAWRVLQASSRTRLRGTYVYDFLTEESFNEAIDKIEEIVNSNNDYVNDIICKTKEEVYDY